MNDKRIQFIKDMIDEGYKLRFMKDIEDRNKVRLQKEFDLCCAWFAID